MTEEFRPIENDIKNSLTQTAENVEKAYPEHLREISQRAEQVVANGSRKVDEANAADIKKILDDLDNNSSRTDITSSARSAEQSRLTSQMRSLLDPDGEAQRASALNNHITQLRTEGHAPGRHLDPDNQTLQTRLGTTKLNPNGTPKLKTTGENAGHVSSENFVDPLTGTTTDGVTGATHRCGPYATKFNNAADMARADDHFRAQLASGTLPARTPISEILGPSGHRNLTGFYKDPADPSKYLPVDFEGGTIRPVYQPDGSGGVKLLTMYPEPRPGRHP